MCARCAHVRDIAIVELLSLLRPGLAGVLEAQNPLGKPRGRVHPLHEGSLARGCSFPNEEGI